MLLFTDTKINQDGSRTFKGEWAVRQTAWQGRKKDIIFTQVGLKRLLLCIHRSFNSASPPSSFVAGFLSSHHLLYSCVCRGYVNLRCAAQPVVPRLLRRWILTAQPLLLHPGRRRPVSCCLDPESSGALRRATGEHDEDEPRSSKVSPWCSYGCNQDPNPWQTRVCKIKAKYLVSRQKSRKET